MSSGSSTMTVNGPVSMPSASTASTESTSTMTTSGMPQVCPPEDLSAVLKSVVDITAFACRAAYPDIYSNTSFTVIQGWPCLSTKRCNSCVMAADPSTPWPCSYSDYQVCTEKNNAGSTKYSCANFFDAFDFIPAGVPVPNITGWENGTNPSSPTSCYSFASGTPSFNNCWLTHECSTLPSSSNLSTLLDQTNPLIDKNFLKTIPAGVSTCDFSKAASTAAINKLSSGGRKKRQATSVDLPGFGSCEYANKNFKSAAECIAWYRRNALLLHVFYEQLQVNSYEQGASYTLVSLISDISGHAGLWLGISVVSMVEILSLFVMIISNFVCGRNIVIDRENVEREAEKRNERESREINSARV
ncbi:hypothetical protein PRIPAC_77381 [Pristionchus pacificus]|nr:hypothetical protein PRIPAC_77381 [Pristionchus pacificus]